MMSEAARLKASDVWQLKHKEMQKAIKLREIPREPLETMPRKQINLNICGAIYNYECDNVGNGSRSPKNPQEIKLTDDKGNQVNRQFRDAEIVSNIGAQVMEPLRFFEQNLIKSSGNDVRNSGGLFARAVVNQETSKPQYNEYFNVAVMSLDGPLLFYNGESTATSYYDDMPVLTVDQSDTESTFDNATYDSDDGGFFTDDDLVPHSEQPQLAQPAYASTTDDNKAYCQVCNKPKWCSHYNHRHVNCRDHCLHAFQVADPTFDALNNCPALPRAVNNDPLPDNLLPANLFTDYVPQHDQAQHREKEHERGSLTHHLLNWYCLVAKPIQRFLWGSMPAALQTVDK